MDNSISKCSNCLGKGICDTMIMYDGNACKEFKNKIARNSPQGEAADSGKDRQPCGEHIKQSESLLLVEAVDMCQENFNKEGRCPVCGSYSQA